MQSRETLSEFRLRMGPFIEYMAKKSAEAMVGMSVEQQRSHIREVMTMIIETTREYLQKP